MRQTKWIGVVLTAAMAASLSACGSSQSSSAAADSSTAAAAEAAATTAAAEDENYVWIEDGTGLALKEWVGTYGKLRQDEHSYVILQSQSLNGSVSWGSVQVAVEDLPEDFDENAEDAYVKRYDYMSYFDSNNVLFSDDENITEDDIKAAIESKYTGDYTLTPFTTESGRTMYEFSAGDANITYCDTVTEETKTTLAEIQKEWDEQKTKLDLVSYNAASGISFSAMDYNGNKVDESIFKNAKITMVNIWGTGCAPCIEEMPDLQKVNDDLDDVQVITIAGDVTSMTDTDCLEEAHDIMSTQGATLTVLLGSKELKEAFPYAATPTSYLVDANGNILGRPRVGAGDYDTYVAWIQEAMEQLN